MPPLPRAKIIAIFSAVGILVAACSTPNTALAAERYEIDASHTHVQFSVLRFGFADTIGTFTGVSGVISLDSHAPENSSVEVEIDVTSLISGDASRDEAVLSKFWFNAGEFATMSFKSISVELDGDNRARVTGDLTLLGVSKPVTLDVTLNKISMDPATKRQAAGFSITGTLNRLDWGMETAANFVGRDVTIRIEALAHKIEE
ncbi:MAG: YceI family protein [Alphaproteobacteria bacterium]|nr:YceI family protein [Alphaproteobacteria bacterium]